MCVCRTSQRVLHLTVVSLCFGQDAGSGGVPLHLVDTAIRGHSAKDRSALHVSCEETRKEEKTDQLGENIRSTT